MPLPIHCTAKNCSQRTTSVTQADIYTSFWWIVTLGLPILFLLPACGDGKRDIRAYYFPVETLRDGVVYAYDRADIDSVAPEYWYYASFLRDSGQFLSGTYYDAKFQISQITTEKITSSGALTRSYFLFEPDSSGEKQVQIPTRIAANNVFPFRVTDSLGVFLFSLQFNPPAEPGSTVYLIRNRRFLGDGPDFDFKGKKYPCVRFGLREAIGNKREGSAEVEGTGEEWYAKGLGLVYYRKQYGTQGFNFSYRLTDTFTMPELERRAGAKMIRK